MRTRSQAVSPGGLLSLPAPKTRKNQRNPSKIQKQFEQQFPLKTEVVSSSTLEEGSTDGSPAPIIPKPFQPCLHCGMHFNPYPELPKVYVNAEVQMDDLTHSPASKQTPGKRSSGKRTRDESEESEEPTAKRLQKSPSTLPALPTMPSNPPALEPIQSSSPTSPAFPNQPTQQESPSQSNGWRSWLSTPFRYLAPSKGTGPNSGAVSKDKTPTQFIKPTRTQSAKNPSGLSDIPVLPMPSGTGRLLADREPLNLRRSIFSDKESSYGPPKAKTNAEVQAQLRKDAKEIEEKVLAELSGSSTPQASKSHWAPPREATPGQKRKLDAFDGMLPGPKNGGFGIDDSYLDMDNEIEGFDESAFDTPAAKKTKLDLQKSTQVPRSVLKKRSTGISTQKAKSVTFNTQPLIGSRPVLGEYGRAGKYNGSVFADTAKSFETGSAVGTPSSISISDATPLFQSPLTSTRTQANVLRAAPDWNTNIRDPQNPTWRPQPHNPRPGEFCLPDFDDEMDDDSTVEQPRAEEQHASLVTDAPPTPRMAHAELPSSVMPSTPSPQGEKILAEIGSPALNKVRATAEKYKPESVGRHSSKLSQVTQARSRSSSPPGSRMATPNPVDPGDQENTSSQDEARDENGMTEFDREHQYDDWARDEVGWPQIGQRLVDQEVFNNPMMYRVRQDWTQQDTEQGKRFWELEYERVEASRQRAQAEGKMLLWL